MSATITTAEFDELARLGFNAIRKCMLSDVVSEADRERAYMALKLADQGTRRMSAETNRAAVAFKIAKEIGANQKVMQPILRQITGSGAVVSKAQGVLEAAESAEKGCDKTNRRNGSK